MRLKDRVALITGAGSGLGLATATLFAREGARVCAVDVSEANGAQALAAIRRAGGQGVYVKADVAKADDVRAAVAATVRAFGALHVLFNNAGIGGGPSGASIERLSEEDWDRVLGVNLKGVFLCSKHAVPEIRKSGGGAIVNTASIAGLISLPTHAYCASKAAVIELTKTMAIELVKDNIRVNAVAPGFIDTPLLRGVTRGVDAAESDRNIAHWAKATPMGRVGRPEDIAAAVLYLASDEASYVTGHTLVVDGGYTVV